MTKPFEVYLCNFLGVCKWRGVRFGGEGVERVQQVEFCAGRLVCPGRLG